MSVKSISAKIFAALVVNRTKTWSLKPDETQRKVFENLITSAKNTQFGRDHSFDKISTYDDFATQVPVRDYEALKPYVDRVVKGEPDILWPGKPEYFAKTSGTTSGAKFIPITHESMPWSSGS